MRYLPLCDADRTAMLHTIGADSVDALYRDVPHGLLATAPLETLPRHQSEIEVERHIAALAAQNVSPQDVPFFCGAGAYRHHIPATVDALIQRGEFLTSYTPYQPEVSQGTLQVLFEFQTQVCRLTGMEVANASMYDGATAATEALLMACRITGRTRALVCGNLHPHTKATMHTQAQWTGKVIETLPPAPSSGTHALDALIQATEAATDDLACVIVQTPDVFGHVHDLTELAARCHAKGALLVVAINEIVSLGLLPPAGLMGADIVVAEGQSLGIPLSYGGPYLGLFATRDAHMRQMPGRLCGESVDEDGKRSFVLTLSTREQHIRREKATSNICTNSGLCALAFSIHLSLLGETGFKKLAALNHLAAQKLVKALPPSIRCLNTDGFFNEVTLDLGRPAAPLVERLAQEGVLAGVPVSRLFGNAPPFENLLLVAATELTTDADITALVKGLSL